MQNEFGAVVYPAQEVPTGDDKTWATIVHILAIFTGPLGPLIVWLVRKDQPGSRFSTKHSLEALAFSLAEFVLFVAISILGFILSCIVIGVFFFLLLPPLWVVCLLYQVLAAVRANEGKVFEYPFTSRFVNLKA